MYEALFRLPTRPFRATPDTRYYFPHDAMESARRTAVRAVDRAEGPVMIVGGAGLGKSLLGELIASDLSGQFDIVRLRAAHLCSRKALLQNILFELQLPYRDLSEGELRLSILDRLQPNQDFRPGGIIIIVDEAHTLSAKLMEELRLITNFTRDNQPRASLILIGNMRLEDLFASPQLESFNQRLAARCYLTPMNRQQTEDYVEHQVRVAGYKPSEFITKDGQQAVFAASEGVPRLVNQVMDHALVLAIGHNQCPISSALVEEAWADMQQFPLPWQTAADRAAAPRSAEVSQVEFGTLDDDGPASEFVFTAVESGAPNLLNFGAEENSRSHASAYSESSVEAPQPTTLQEPESESHKFQFDEVEPDNRNAPHPPTGSSGSSTASRRQQSVEPLFRFTSEGRAADEIPEGDAVIPPGAYFFSESERTTQPRSIGTTSWIWTENTENDQLVLNDLPIGRSVPIFDDQPDLDDARSDTEQNNFFAAFTEPEADDLPLMFDDQTDRSRIVSSTGAARSSGDERARYSMLADLSIDIDVPVVLPSDSFFEGRETDEQLLALSEEQHQFDSIAQWQEFQSRQPQLLRISDDEDVDDPTDFVQERNPAAVERVPQNPFGDDFDEELSIDQLSINNRAVIFSTADEGGPGEVIENLADTLADSLQEILRDSQSDNSLLELEGLVMESGVPDTLPDWSFEVHSMEWQREAEIQREIEDLVSQLNFSGFSDSFSVEQISVAADAQGNSNPKWHSRNVDRREISSLETGAVPEHSDPTNLFGDNWASYDDDRDMLVVEEDVSLKPPALNVEARPSEKKASYTQLFAKMRR
jgi:type II secretory pathway predicted ATPase ExeA